jgi:beta-phosphoglucomutase-like phosphatase (HAD superfamily)
MVEALAADLEIAIATTTSVANVKALLETNFPAEIVAAIRIIGAGDMVTKKKPAPDVYDLVVEKLGFKPGECIAFEDSRNGLLSAMAAHIPTLITPGIYTDDHDFTGAASVVSDLGQPGAPCQHIAGGGAEFEHVSVEMLRMLV